MYPEGGSFRSRVSDACLCPYCSNRASYFPSFPDRVLNPC
jgi:hypothetical protein